MLQGIVASLVTNFTAQGEIDERGIEENVRYLTECGIHGVCVAGGTGEALSLSPDEYRRAVSAALKGAAGQSYVVAGALYLDPARIIDCCRFAKESGVAAVMLIPPYFVRPSPRQLVEHFESIAQQVDIPLILFNSPGRSGINMDAELVVGLAKRCPNIVGIKEASGDLAKVSAIISQTEPDFSVLQGLDDLVFPTLALGGSGALISLGTILPRVYVTLYNRWLDGDYAAARALQFSVLRHLPAVYAETNPVGLKRTLELLGRPGGPPRAPLHPISQANDALLRAAVPDLIALEEQVVGQAKEVRAESGQLVRGSSRSVE